MVEIKIEIHLFALKIKRLVVWKVS